MERDKLTDAKAEANAVVQRWRDRVMARNGVTAAEWARSAGVSPTTVSRNMQADFDATSKIENLHLLARAVGQPSVLDFLDGDAMAMPTDDDLESMIDGALRELDHAKPYARALASALRTRLLRYSAVRPSDDDASEGTSIAPDEAAQSRPPTTKSARG